MISDAKVSNRIAAYGVCYLDYANKSITATTFGEKECADKEYRSMIYMMWAQSVMKRFRCDCLTEEYVCAVMAKADPICSKCQCAGSITNPITPVIPCNITPDWTVARTVIASDQQNLIGGPYFIISNNNAWPGTWGNRVGYIVNTDGTFTAVMDGAVVYDQFTATYWTNSPTFVPGQYMPVMNGAYVGGSLIVSSPYPAVSALFNRLVKVETFVDGEWVRLYGPDSEQYFSTPQSYTFATQPTKMRTSYSIGYCPPCPDPNLTHEWVSAGGGLYNLEVTMAVTVGFTPGEIYVEQDGVNSSPQTFGALPDTLTFTGLDGTNPVTLHFINLVAGCAPYVENLGVPFICGGAGLGSVTLGDGGGLYCLINDGSGGVDDSGYFTTRLSDGTIVTHPSGTFVSVVNQDSICFWASDVDGNVFGQLHTIGTSLAILKDYSNIGYDMLTVGHDGYLGTSLSFADTPGSGVVTGYDLALDCEGSDNVTSIDLSANGAATGQLLMFSNSVLASVLFPALSNSPFINFSVCALDQTSVDAILAGADISLGSSLSVHLQGGTNSAPSATGLSRKSDLEAAGATVFVNP